MKYQQQQSHFICSDCEKEITLMIAAHHQLQISYNQDIEFNQCYLYDMSVLNQRIEVWWS